MKPEDFKITIEELNRLSEKYEPNIENYIGAVLNLVIRKHNQLIEYLEERKEDV